RSLLVVVLLAPPRFPILPYTTLFRSGGQLPHHLALGDRVPGDDLGQQRGVETDVQGDQLVPVVDAPPVGADGGLADVGELVVGQDRKSTRLNSSHVKISYAVFCLKKK